MSRSRQHRHDRQHSNTVSTHLCVRVLCAGQGQATGRKGVWNTVGHGSKRSGCAGRTGLPKEGCAGTVGHRPAQGGAGVAAAAATWRVLVLLTPLLLLSAGWCSPPLGSSSILSMERGPSVVRMMSDTACSSSMETHAAHKRAVLRYVSMVRQHGWQEEGLWHRPLLCRPLIRHSSMLSAQQPCQDAPLLLQCCHPGPSCPSPALCWHSAR